MNAERPRAKQVTPGVTRDIATGFISSTYGYTTKRYAEVFQAARAFDASRTEEQRADLALAGRLHRNHMAQPYAGILIRNANSTDGSVEGIKDARAEALALFPPAKPAKT